MGKFIVALMTNPLVAALAAGLTMWLWTGSVLAAVVVAVVGGYLADVVGREDGP